MDIGIYKPVNSEVRGVTAGNLVSWMVPLQHFMLLNYFFKFVIKVVVPTLREIIKKEKP